jgi:DNA primase
MGAVDSLLDLAPQLAAGMQKGSDHVMVRCPYHGGGQERTPSMSISTTKPVFFCFGCKASGHLSRLLTHFGMSREGVAQILPRDLQFEAPESIAAKLVRGVDPFRGKFVLDEALLDYYRLAPTKLLNAGFAERTLRHFEVGFDNKNMRITFPLRTTNGELVGISGRAVYDEDEPRYRIYDRELRERQGFHIPDDYSMAEVKSAILWHAHVVRPFFFVHGSGKEEILVTEGFKACMWLFQAGFEDVVALVGSYLTPLHAELLARATRKVTLALDNNEAGWKGTARAGRLLTSKGVEVSVIKYPDHREQPDNLRPDEVADSIVQKQTLRAWIAEHPGYDKLPTSRF